MGRKGTLIISAIIYGAGVALQVPAPPAGVFVLGRILLGMGLGLISVTVSDRRLFRYNSTSSPSTSHADTISSRLCT